MNTEYFRTCVPSAFDPDVYVLSMLEDNQGGLTSPELAELTGVQEEVIVECLNRLSDNPEVFMSLDSVGVYFFVRNY